MGVEQHRQQAEQSKHAPIPCGIITISDTRTRETDTSGQYLHRVLPHAGHDVVRYELVRDEPDQIAALVQELVGAGCKVIITSGGTGITRRDSTFEAIDALLEKRLPGFGEIFRVLSSRMWGLRRCSHGRLPESINRHSSFVCRDHKRLLHWQWNG